MLTVAAAVWLATLLLNGAGSDLPRRALPAPILYFGQATCLFPNAAVFTIDYRVEAWECGERRFHETDPRPFFPIHADDKESRFHRVGYFYRRNRQVMRAFERYLIEQHRAEGRNVGGIRLSSLRIPFPDPGEPVRRWEQWAQTGLADFPESQVKRWYYTPVSRRRVWCAGEDPDAQGEADR